MLSTRSQVAAQLPTCPLWTVLGDQYCAVKNPTGYVNLGVAENTLMRHELVAQLKKHFNPGPDAFSYGTGPGGSLKLRSALAQFFNRYFTPLNAVEATQINVANGVTSSLERCAFEMADPGDFFLLGRPYYGSYASDVGDRAGVNILPVAFGDIDPLDPGAVRCYEEAIISVNNNPEAGGRVRALLLCSPHNPLGRCYPLQTLKDIMRLCQKYQIHLICDEIYALSIYDNPLIPQAEPFVSLLSIDLEEFIDPALVHIMWGLSKDFGANGMRIGCVVSQKNAELMASLNYHGAYSFPSAMLEHMVCCILEDADFTDTYISKNQDKLRTNFLQVLHFMKSHDIPYKTCNAGLYIWVNLGSYVASLQASRVTAPRKDRAAMPKSVGLKKKGKTSYTSDDVIIQTLHKNKIFLCSGKSCGSEDEGWFRVVFSQQPDVLKEGLFRMMTALRSLS